jgi:hypothetical protein
MRPDARNILMVGAGVLAVSYLFNFRNIPVIGTLDFIDRDSF